MPNEGRDALSMPSAQTISFYYLQKIFFEDMFFGFWSKAHSHTRGMAIIILGLLSAVGMPGYAKSVLAGSISISSVSSGSYTVGTVVRYSGNEISYASTDNLEGSLGVVSTSGANTIVFSEGVIDRVLTISGEVEVLASDINGVIKQGDKVAISWLEGTIMKFDANSNYELKVVGVALEDMDMSQSVEYGAVESPGGEIDARVGIVDVQLYDSSAQSSAIAENSFITGITKKISGKNLSSERALAGLLVFLMSLVLAGNMIVSAIRTGLTSIGRNPMSSSSIFKSLVHISGISVVVILIGTTLSYVVLTI